MMTQKVGNRDEFSYPPGRHRKSPIPRKSLIRVKIVEVDNAEEFVNVQLENGPSLWAYARDEAELVPPKEVLVFLNLYSDQFSVAKSHVKKREFHLSPWERYGGKHPVNYRFTGQLKGLYDWQTVSAPPSVIVGALVDVGFDLFTYLQTGADFRFGYEAVVEGVGGLSVARANREMLNELYDVTDSAGWISEEKTQRI